VFNIPNYLEKNITLPPCYELENAVFVSETGNVYACPDLENISLGNLKEKKLSEILSSKEFLQMKEKIRRLDCPGCWNDCAILNNLNHTYHGLIKYPAKIASMIVPPRIWNRILFN
jgi:MoaA/NifB/PqqE/SkfB family radical SAM enzyme